MDLDSIKRCWEEDADVVAPRLEEEAVMRMIASRATDLRREVRRRLRREAGYYLPIVAVWVVGSVMAGLTINRVLAGGSVVLLLGAVMATLWWAERRIEDARLDLSLREALIGLTAHVNVAAHAYVAVYVAVFVVAAVALGGAVWWRFGASLYLAGAITAGALGVAWSLRSGRRYVERMFRRYRAELAECLAELEAQV